jgi:hypothetical protein
MTPERAALILSASLVTDRWRSTAVVLNGQQYELFLSNEFAAVVAAEWTSDSRSEKVPEETSQAHRVSVRVGWASVLE